MHENEKYKFFIQFILTSLWAQVFDKALGVIYFENENVKKLYQIRKFLSVLKTKV